MSKHGNRVLLGVIVGVSVTIATVITLSMGQPTDIRNDDPAFQAQPSSVEASQYGPQPSTVHTYGPDSATDQGATDHDASGDVACWTPTDEGTPENLAGCDFEPTVRYDYVDGAWRAVGDDYTYSNGNRPPLGSELTATQNGTE